MLRGWNVRRQRKKDAKTYAWSRAMSDKEAILRGLDDQGALLDAELLPHYWTGEEIELRLAEWARQLAPYVATLSEDDPRIAALACYRHPVSGYWPVDPVLDHDEWGLYWTKMEPDEWYEDAFTFAIHPLRVRYHDCPELMLAVLAAIADGDDPPPASTSQLRAYAEWVDQHAPGARALERWQALHPDETS